jgi:formylglycine-generating enzyme required for sulfatase activity
VRNWVADQPAARHGPFPGGLGTNSRFWFLALALFLYSRGVQAEELVEREIAFLKIPAGSFEMGTSAQDLTELKARKLWTRFNECECPRHWVTIARPFWISKCEITQKQWQAVMGQNPSAFKGGDLPVDSVSWNDVGLFLKKLNPEGKALYRLPTEAEWEYCCRAGTSNLWALTELTESISETNFTARAWFRSNADNKTHPAGQTKPNAWGLFDMQGNVWEWCQDFYSADFYAASKTLDPVNRTSSTERVLRGGSWFLDWVYLRPACRSGNWQDFRSQYVGFRLVREAEQPIDKP